MHPSLQHTAHRPWPLPARRWRWRQTWRDLLFAHWRVDAARLRALVPDSLEIDEFDGSSWIGVVPFRMTGVMLRGVPDLPGISAFPELNLRLYVTREGRPGVLFLSLDATNALAVWAARRFFHLPYHRARIQLRESADGIRYEHARRAGGGAVRFVADYRATADVDAAQPGTLEHFLTERYCLYAPLPGGRLSCTEVHHALWPLQRAEATIHENTLATPHGLELVGPPATLHFARRLDVVVWSPTEG